MNDVLEELNVVLQSLRNLYLPMVYQTNLYEVLLSAAQEIEMLRKKLEDKEAEHE